MRALSYLICCLALDRVAGHTHRPGLMIRYKFKDADSRHVDSIFDLLNSVAYDMHKDSQRNLVVRVTPMVVEGTSVVPNP